jgi:uncharacterized protein (UPF0548 family)
MFRVTKPSPEDVARFLTAAAASPLSYREVGIAWGPPPAGYNVDGAEVRLGTGDGTFRNAVDALRRWTMFDLGWMTATPSADSIAPSVNVVVLVRHLGFWSLNACRVVYLLSSDAKTERWGFAYGTLRDHAEEGEEVFEVCLDRATGEVAYRLRAVSRPRALLARLGYPYARRLQTRFRLDSCRRMRMAVTPRARTAGVDGIGTTRPGRTS